MEPNNTIKHQEKVRFDNMLLQAGFSEFKKYPFPSIGLVIHYLYVYGLQQYDCTTISHENVYLYGKGVASYVWDNSLQMPIFEFSNDFDHLKDSQAIYLKGLKMVRHK